MARLHDAVRAGKLKPVKLILQTSDDVNGICDNPDESPDIHHSRKNNGKTALMIALQRYKSNAQQEVLRQILIALLNAKADPQTQQGTKTVVDAFLSEHIRYRHEHLESEKTYNQQQLSGEREKEEDDRTLENIIEDLDKQIQTAKEHPTLVRISVDSCFIDSLYILLFYKAQSERFPHFLLLRDIALQHNNQSLLKTLAGQCTAADRKRLAELLSHIQRLSDLTLLIEAGFDGNNILPQLLSLQFQQQINIGNRRGGAPLGDEESEKKAQEEKLAWEKVLSLCVTEKNVNQVNARGEAPIFLALQTNHLIAVNFLLDHGALVNGLVDARGQSAMDHAIHLGNLALIQRLEGLGLLMSQENLQQMLNNTLSYYHRSNAHHDFLINLIERGMLPTSSYTHFEQMKHLSLALVQALLAQNFDFSMMDHTARTPVHLMLQNTEESDMLSMLAAIENSGFVLVPPPIPVNPEEVDSDDEEITPLQQSNLLLSVISPFVSGSYSSRNKTEQALTPYDQLAMKLLNAGALHDPLLDKYNKQSIYASLLVIATRYQNDALFDRVMAEIPEEDESEDNTYSFSMPIAALRSLVVHNNIEQVKKSCQRFSARLKQNGRTRDELQSLLFLALELQHFELYRLLAQHFEQTTPYLGLWYLGVEKQIVFPEDIQDSLMPNTLSFATLKEQVYLEAYDNQPTNLACAPEEWREFYCRFMTKLIHDDPSALSEDGLLNTLLLFSLETQDSPLFSTLVKAEKSNFLECFHLLLRSLSTRVDVAAENPEQQAPLAHLLDNLVNWCIAALTPEDLRKIQLFPFVRSLHPNGKKTSPVFSEDRPAKLIRAGVLVDTDTAGDHSVRETSFSAMHYNRVNIIAAIIRMKQLPVDNMVPNGKTNALEHAIQHYQVAMVTLLLDSEYRDTLLRNDNLFSLLTEIYKPEYHVQAIAMFDCLVSNGFSPLAPLTQENFVVERELPSVLNSIIGKGKTKHFMHLTDTFADHHLIVHFLHQYPDVLVDEYTLHAALKKNYPVDVLDTMVSRGGKLRLNLLKGLINTAIEANVLEQLDWLLTYAEKQFGNMATAATLITTPKQRRWIAKNLSEALINILIKHHFDFNTRDFLGNNVKDYAIIFEKSELFSESLPEHCAPDVYQAVKAYLIEKEAEFFVDGEYVDYGFGEALDDPAYLLGSAAHKLSTLFESCDQAIAFITKYRDLTSLQPIHDLILFNLPPSPNWCKKTWAALAVEHGPALTKYLSFAPRVELLLKRPPQSLQEIEGVAKHIHYGREEENMLLATIAKQYQVSEAGFNAALTNYHPKAKDHLPDIHIQGSELKIPSQKDATVSRYYLKKLLPKDLTGFILGAEIGFGCCQSIGSEGHSCAMHGMNSPYGGFYVLYKNLSSLSCLPLIVENLEKLRNPCLANEEAGPAQAERKQRGKKPRSLLTETELAIEVITDCFIDQAGKTNKAQKIKYTAFLNKYFKTFKIRTSRPASFEDLKDHLLQHLQKEARGDIIAQAWAWLAADGSLVFDSIELKAHDETHEEISTAFFIEAAKRAVLRYGLQEVLVGTGGKTPSAFSEKFVKVPPKNPKDYFDYRDSKEQVLICSQKTFAARKIQAFWREHRRESVAAGSSEEAMHALDARDLSSRT